MDVIDYLEALQECIKDSDWQCRWMGEQSPYLYLSGAEGAPRLYLSTGIHGDEPAGPMAVLSMLQEASFFEGQEVHLFPLLNPVGLTAGTRENGEGVDLNRNYGPNPVEAAETQWHMEILKTLPRMDAGLCLHEDWEASGVYLYHVDAHEPRFHGRGVLGAMAQHLPVEMDEVIDGSDAVEGLIAKHESEYTPDEWPEAIYLCRVMTGASLTLETPSSAPLEQRVAAHRAGVTELIRQLRARDSIN